MNIGERIRYVRETAEGKKISMATFAARIKASPAAVSQWETGDRNPTDVYIRTISREFGVSETWLLTGEGEMHAPLTREQELAQITTDLYNADPDGSMYKFMKELSKLKPETWKDIGNFINKVASRSDEPE